MRRRKRDAATIKKTQGEAAVRIQAIVRGHLARCRVRCLRARRHAAATTIQVRAGHSLARSSPGFHRHALRFDSLGRLTFGGCLLLQRSLRGRTERQAVARLRLRLTRAAVEIQRRWRGGQQRATFRRQRAAAAVLQRYGRGMLGRRLAARR